MSPLEPSESARPASHLSTAISDLTSKIVRPDGWQYCAAGGFGDVFRCLYTGDDGVKEVAVKAFRFSFSVNDSEDKHDAGKTGRMIRRELGIWRRLRHSNIVPFLGIAYGFGTQGSASLVSVWMPHGTLHTFLERHDGQLTVVRRLQLLLDIANGLHYLHSFPMIHGDLSSANVLLDHNYNACLSDFGCATLVGELPEGFTYLKTSTLRPGTLRWAAPEHFSLNEEETKHTIKSDIYSFGNMALLVLSGKHPWSEVRADAAVVLRLSQGLKPARPLSRLIDDQHWTLIERCWSSIPERPPAEDVVCSLQQFLSAVQLSSTTRSIATRGQNSFIGDGDIDDIPLHALSPALSGSTHGPTPVQLATPHQNDIPGVPPIDTGNTLTTSPSQGAAPYQETHVHKAMALYAYTADPSDPREISFSRGETLDISGTDGKWWVARKTDGTTGIVPSNYLQIIAVNSEQYANSGRLQSSSQETTHHPELYTYRAKALFTYNTDPSDPREVSLTKGEILDVLDKRARWWSVKKLDGTIGIAPSNYLQLV